MRIYLGFPRISSRPGDEYISLIRFLLESGADPNVSRTPKHSDRSISYVDDYQGTTCDLLTVPIAFHIRIPTSAQMPKLLYILELLTDAGGHTSEPFEHTAFFARSKSFREEIQHLNIFEDQIDSKFCSQFDRIQSLICQFGALAISCR
jgi:hypothetical protein